MLGCKHFLGVTVVVVIKSCKVCAVDNAMLHRELRKHLTLVQVSAISSPHGQIPVSVDKVVLNTARSYHISIVCGCSYTTVTR